MNELIDFRMQQQIAHEIYRQQIMQRIPDPFPQMFPFALPGPHMLLPAAHPGLPAGVDAKLENDELWQEFHEIGTEMIITKTGRRLFPSLRISLTGLEDDSTYCVLLEMIPISDCRYKFSGSNWVPAGGAEPQSPQRVHLHPDSPASGAHWQTQPILFNKVKLTNNTLDNNGHIVLTSMHKYRIRLHVIRSADLAQIPWAPQKAFEFRETEFIAVTAYQNDRITKLKIDNNPFAKGFRESGQSRCKRKMSSSPNLDEQNEMSCSSNVANATNATYDDRDRQQLEKRARLPDTTSSLSGALQNYTATRIHLHQASLMTSALSASLEATQLPSIVDFACSQSAQLHRLHHQQRFFTPAMSHLYQQQQQQQQQQQHISHAGHVLENAFLDQRALLTDDNDSFIDVVSTSAAPSEAPAQHISEPDAPVIITGKYNSFSISSILGGRNVVAV